VLKQVFDLLVSFPSWPGIYTGNDVWRSCMFQTSTISSCYIKSSV